VYGGRSVWGKQRRFEELLDLNDVSAGHVTRMRWRASSEWIEATTPRTQALVDEATLVAVANRIGGGARREKQRDVVHPYLLRGIVRCDLCGRKMQGSARRSRIAGSPTRVLYRCEFGARRSVPIGMDHPPTVYVREDAIVSRLDAWLAEIVTPEALASAQAMPPDVAAQHVAVRAAMADCDVRIKRLLESIESGIDHELVAPRVRELQAERSRLEATLGAHKVWRRLSAREIAEWADSLGGVVQVLKQANPEDRAALYAEFGLTLRYDPTRHQIKATAELSRVARGVGGGT
jgi:hypothetical protein